MTLCFMIAKEKDQLQTIKIVLVSKNLPIGGLHFSSLVQILLWVYILKDKRAICYVVDLLFSL